MHAVHSETATFTSTFRLKTEIERFAATRVTRFLGSEYNRHEFEAGAWGGGANAFWCIYSPL